MTLRYGWIGESRIEQLRTAILECVQAWLREWAVHAGAEAEVRPTAMVALASDEAHVMRLGPSGAQLLLCVSADEHAALGAWLTGTEATGSLADATAEIARSIASEALSDLALQLAHRANLHGIAPEGQGTAAWPVGSVRPELGAVGMHVVLGDIGLSVALERGFVDAICPAPPAPTAAAALEPREQSIGSAVVALSAVLDFGSMAARDFFDLQPGEVLVGECPLDAPATLHVQGTAALVEARMCKVGAQRAVALMTSPNRQEKQ